MIYFSDRRNVWHSIFRPEKGWSCRYVIFRIKAHPKSYFSGRTIRNFWSCRHFILGTEKAAIFYFRTKNAFQISLLFGQNQLSIFWGRCRHFYFSDRRSCRNFIFWTEKAFDVLFFGQSKPTLCVSRIFLYWVKNWLFCTLVTSLQQIAH
jgi:hypothetical protein